MLVGSNLTLWRGTTRLFEDLSFVLPAGRPLIIAGPNGAGKTTLLRVIAGLTMPETGEVTWQGSPLRREVQAANLALAFSGHALALKPELSARENLEFSARLAGRSPLVGKTLAESGLADCADLPVRLLSAGQKRRAALARVLLSGADLWLMDEPQTNLDAAGRRYLDEVVQRHLAAGGTLVVATHQPLELGAIPVTRLVLGDAG